MGRILCVDDEPNLLVMLRIALTAAGHTVFTSTDGNEAIEIARREHIRVFLLDLRMAKMDGVELCRRLRAQDAGAAIYAVSGYVDAYTPEQFEAFGFDGCVQKPFEIGRLAEVCKAALSKVEGSGA